MSIRGQDLNRLLTINHQTGDDMKATFKLLLEIETDIKRLEAENHALKQVLKASGGKVVKIEYRLNTDDLHYLTLALVAGDYLIESSGPKLLHGGTHSQEIGLLVAEKQP